MRFIGKGSFHLLNHHAERPFDARSSHFEGEVSLIGNDDLVFAEPDNDIALEANSRSFSSKFSWRVLNALGKRRMSKAGIMSFSSGLKMSTTVCCN